MCVMKFSALIKGVPGVEEVRVGSNAEIVRISEDSRKVRAGDLFVARSGTKVSGAAYALEAVAKGAVAVVADVAVELPAGVDFARVNNANLALGVMAQRFYGDPGKELKILGVTGTKGKTTVVYLLRAILRSAGEKSGLVSTVEIDNGTGGGAGVVESTMTTPGPLELAELMGQMRANGARYCVMEVSSHALHQSRVGGIEFAVGMFSNLTGDHLDYHGTMEAYGEAKALLFQGLNPQATAVVNGDDAWVALMTRGCPGRVVKYGLKAGADWSAEIKEMTGAGVKMRVRGPGVEFALQSPLVGVYNVYNTLCAVAAAVAVGIGVDKIVRGLEEMTGAPGRLQAVVPAGMSREELPFQVLVDYAHTHDALDKMLEAVRELTPAPAKLICVFGCGGDRDRTKRPKMAAAAEKWADQVVVTSDNPRTEDPAAIINEIMTGFKQPAQVTVEADRRAAIAHAVGLGQRGDVLVIAGKGHENYQIIGQTKHHFDDVEEAKNALAQRGIGK